MNAATILLLAALADWDCRSLADFAAMSAIARDVGVSRSQRINDTLVKAGTKIISTRIIRSFPLPAECKEACLHARQKVYQKPNPWD